MSDETSISNFIPISRKIFQNDLWLEKREFSRFEAWLDLLQTVSHKVEPQRIIINNIWVTYGRGQFPCSLRFLQERWGWGSTTKIRRFLECLKSNTMITQQKTQGISVITICKYDDYNPLKIHENTSKKLKVTQRKHKVNNERNNNIDLSKDKSGVPPVLPSLFGEEVVPPVIIQKPTSERARLFIDKFNKIRAEKTGEQSKYQATPSVIRSFGARLKDYTPAQILLAVKNVFDDKWHRENNYQHVTPDYILRPAKMEKYVNVTTPVTPKLKMVY